MNIQTKYHGILAIDEKKIITFEKGIPGFPRENQFVLLPLTEDELYQVMQSVQTANVAFVVTIPFLFFPDYEFDLDDGVVEQLEVERPEDVQVLTILTVREPFEKTTANLQAPIVINWKNKKGKQVILNDDTYSVRHRLFPTPNKEKGAAKC
ncbi:flagellar assembly protein FliW [Fervidibacillus halotolerans]|uniref:Flagellar assembly factor FliW n=1 Tax=Fervidibacillus halotolerans TaxID=2980027 RepID=A0A9E8M0E3_9BACI|nr:flagellar assembly protein FliW [Fervidibacillus halotolerans]WAA12024.1 flagellar assembly protein FliW [Fervidibacillus halotolerans]